MDGRDYKEIDLSGLENSKTPEDVRAETNRLLQEAKSYLTHFKLLGNDEEYKGALEEYNEVAVAFDKAKEDEVITSHELDELRIQVSHVKDGTGGFIEENLEIPGEQLNSAKEWVVEKISTTIIEFNEELVNGGVSGFNESIEKFSNFMESEYSLLGIGTSLKDIIGEDLFLKITWKLDSLKTSGENLNTKLFRLSDIVHDFGEGIYEIIPSLAGNIFEQAHNKATEGIITNILNSKELVAVGYEEEKGYKVKTSVDFAKEIEIHNYNIGYMNDTEIGTYLCSVNNSGMGEQETLNHLIHVFGPTNLLKILNKSNTCNFSGETFSGANWPDFYKPYLNGFAEKMIQISKLFFNSRPGNEIVNVLNSSSSLPETGIIISGCDLCNKIESFSLDDIKNISPESWSVLEIHQKDFANGLREKLHILENTPNILENFENFYINNNIPESKINASKVELEKLIEDIGISTCSMEYVEKIKIFNETYFPGVIFSFSTENGANDIINSFIQRNKNTNEIAFIDLKYRLFNETGLSTLEIQNIFNIDNVQVRNKELSVLLGKISNTETKKILQETLITQFEFKEDIIKQEIRSEKIFQNWSYFEKPETQNKELSQNDIKDIIRNPEKIGQKISTINKPSQVLAIFNALKKLNIDESQQVKLKDLHPSVLTAEVIAQYPYSFSLQDIHFFIPKELLGDERIINKILKSDINYMVDIVKRLLGSNLSGDISSIPQELLATLTSIINIAQKYAIDNNVEINFADIMARGKEINNTSNISDIASKISPKNSPEETQAIGKEISDALSIKGNKGFSQEDIGEISSVLDANPNLFKYIDYIHFSKDPSIEKFQIEAIQKDPNNYALFPPIISANSKLIDTLIPLINKGNSKLLRKIPLIDYETSMPLIWKILENKNIDISKETSFLIKVSDLLEVLTEEQKAEMLDNKNAGTLLGVLGAKAEVEKFQIERTKIIEGKDVLSMNFKNTEDYIAEVFKDLDERSLKNILNSIKKSEGRILDNNILIKALTEKYGVDLDKYEEVMSEILKRIDTDINENLKRIESTPAKKEDIPPGAEKLYTEQGTLSKELVQREWKKYLEINNSQEQDIKKLQNDFLLSLGYTPETIEYNNALSFIKSEYTKVSNAFLGNNLRENIKNITENGGDTTNLKKDFEEKYLSGEISYDYATGKIIEKNEKNTSSEKSNTRNQGLNKSAEGRALVNYGGETKLIVNENTQITLSKEDIKAIKNNPEAEKNLINMYLEFKNLGLERIWEHKDAIFKVMGNKSGFEFNAQDGDYLDTREINVLLSTILYTSTGDSKYRETGSSLAMTRSKILRLTSGVAGENNVETSGKQGNILEKSFIDKFTFRNSGDASKFNFTSFQKALNGDSSENLTS